MSIEPRTITAGLLALMTAVGCSGGATTESAPTQPAAATVSATEEPPPSRVELRFDEGVPIFLPRRAVREERELSHWVPRIYRGPAQWTSLRATPAGGEAQVFNPMHISQRGGEFRIAPRDGGGLVLIVTTPDTPPTRIEPLAAIAITVQQIDDRVPLRLVTPSGTREITPDALAEMHDMQRRQGRPGVTLARLLERFGGEGAARMSIRIEAVDHPPRLIAPDDVDGPDGRWALYHDSRGRLQAACFQGDDRGERIRQVTAVHFVTPD